LRWKRKRYPVDEEICKIDDKINNKENEIEHGFSHNPGLLMTEH
jgi:hypothetical protein